MKGGARRDRLAPRRLCRTSHAPSSSRENQLELRFTVDPDTTWSLDGSTNLLDWISLLTTNSPDGVLYFHDSMTLPRRFYRARQLLP